MEKVYIKELLKFTPDMLNLNNKNKMKTKITNLADMAMSERTMNSFAGGATCSCACRKASSLDNGSANHAEGLSSPGIKTDQDIWLDDVIVKP